MNMCKARTCRSIENSLALPKHALAHRDATTAHLYEIMGLNPLALNDSNPRK